MIVPSPPDVWTEMNIADPGSSVFLTPLLGGRETHWTKMLFHSGPFLEYEDENIKLENHLLSCCFGFGRKMDERDQTLAKISKQPESHWG